MKTYNKKMMALAVLSILIAPTFVQARGGGERGHMESHPQESMGSHEGIGSHEGMGASHPQTMESHPDLQRESTVNRDLQNRNAEDLAGWTGEGSGCWIDASGNSNCN